MNRYVVSTFDMFNSELKMHIKEAFSPEEAMLEALETSKEELIQSGYEYSIEGIQKFGFDCDMPINVLDVREIISCP